MPRQVMINDDFKKMSKRTLQSIELEVTKNGGFVLWVKEAGRNNKVFKHWLVDASCFREDGEIRLGSVGNNYQENVIVEKTTYNVTAIKFVTRKKKQIKPPKPQKKRGINTYYYGTKTILRTDGGN